ncbi:class I SAM-dependent methyltransferase [Coleofasciculus sp. H7-2]|uniref:class I SAM-dependent methyltransferase n=1 Tax=Coleofasciculus sp. H7-2 TaxID=3351545 RepID=UPI00366D7CAC
MDNVEKLKMYEMTAKSYDLIALEYRSSNSLNSTFVKTEIDTLLLQKIKPNAQILDIGCGTGIYTRHIADLGYEVVGVDSSGISIQNAKLLSPHNNATYKKINFLHYPEECVYDGILINSMFHHIQKADAFPFLLKCNSLLDKNGKILFIVRCYPKSSESLVCECKYGKKTERIYSKYLEEELYQLISECGFHVVSKDIYSHLEHFEEPYHHIVLTKANH